LTYIFPLTVWVYLHSIFLVGSVKRFFPQECVSAVQGHPRSFWYESKARMRLPISPS